jgi:putative membrane protein
MKVRKLTTALLAAACLIGSMPGANAQHESARDREFMRDAARGGVAEVRLGELARNHASSYAVRRFGERMVRDHSRANDSLMSLARREHISLPRDMGAKNQRIYDRLSRLSGPRFDRAYMRDMVRDHQEDVAEFRRESRVARDPDLRHWVSTTLPTLQDHLMMARETSHAIGGRAGMRMRMRRRLR